MLVPTKWGVRPIDPSRHTDVHVPIETGRQLHREFHEAAGQVLEELLDGHSELNRDSAFLGFSVAIPADQIAAFRRILFELQLAAMHAAEALGARVTAEGPTDPSERPSSDANRVYHVNVQAFPVTRWPVA